MSGSSMLIATTISSSMFAGMLLALLPRLPGLVAPQLGLTTPRWRSGQTATLLALVLMMVGAGIGIDKWGVRPVLLSGLLMAMLGLTLLERCHTKSLAILGCVLFGAAAGATVSSTVLLFSQTFYPDHPAASSNLGFIGLTFGMLVAPGLADWLTRRLGVGRALPLLALLGLAPAGLACLTAPNEFPTLGALGSLEELSRDLHWWFLAGAVVSYQAIERSLPNRLLTSARFWFIAGQALAVYFLPSGLEAAMIVLFAVCLAILLGNTLGNDRPLSNAIGLAVAFTFIGPLLPTLIGMADQRYAIVGQPLVVPLLLAINALVGAVLAPLGRSDPEAKTLRGPSTWCLVGLLLLIGFVLAFRLI